MFTSVVETKRSIGVPFVSEVTNSAGTALSGTGYPSERLSRRALVNVTLFFNFCATAGYLPSAINFRSDPSMSLHMKRVILTERRC